MSTQGDIDVFRAGLHADLRGRLSDYLDAFYKGECHYPVPKQIVATSPLAEADGFPRCVQHIARADFVSP